MGRVVKTCERNNSETEIGGTFLIRSQQGSGTTSSMKEVNVRRTQPLCFVANADEMCKL